MVGPQRLLLSVFNAEQSQSPFPLTITFWLLNRHATLPPVQQSREKPEESGEFNFQG